jgi:hypothetical protein
MINLVPLVSEYIAALYCGSSSNVRIFFKKLKVSGIYFDKKMNEHIPEYAWEEKLFFFSSVNIYHLFVHKAKVFVLENTQIFGKKSINTLGFIDIVAFQGLFQSFQFAIYI